MNKQDLVLVDAIVLMNDLVADYIDFFQFTDKNKNERLINASNVHETTLVEYKSTLIFENLINLLSVLASVGMYFRGN